MKKALIILPLMAIFLTGCGNAGSGMHTGYITAVEEVGWIARVGHVYVKTDVSSSQEDVYCFEGDEIMKKLEKAQLEKRLVTLHFRQEVIAAPWRCDRDDTFITDISE